MSAISRNLHDLFASRSGDSLLNNILLSKQEDDALMTARKKIREHIRRDLSKLLQESSGDPTLKIDPKFFMQGSKSYGTLLSPMYPPRQQADLDDGVFIPLSYATNYGSPKLVSKHYTNALEFILEDLAREEGWQVDKTNPNCTRVILTKAGEVPNKHVDVSAYCMPDREFIALIEARVALNKAQGYTNFSERDVDTDDNWDFYPTEHVLHAHKEKGWQHSDPRPFRDWFLRQIALKTEQLRRITYYIKAWRDAQSWSNSDPKSILLMVATDMAFQRVIADRDDLQLQSVLHELPRVLQGRIENPAKKGEYLDQRLDDDGIRAEVVSKVHALAQALDQALSGVLTDQQIHDSLRRHWGHRFPAYVASAAPRPAAVVRATPAAPVAAAATIGVKKSG